VLKTRAVRGGEERTEALRLRLDL